MARLPFADGSLTARAIDAWHENQNDPPRPHLGASLLGKKCDRAIWLSFRWAVREKFSGRMRRLFRRGHREEISIMQDIEAIGCKFEHAPKGGQHRVEFGSHVSGSLDAIIASGVPEAPAKRHVAEFKTHSCKSFNTLVNGVERAKPEHFAQMQAYMLGTGIDRALYVAVCKDNDRIHIERVRFDREVAESLVARGRRLALAPRVPEPFVGASVDWYECKFCPSHDFCFGSRTTKEINCRTCAHSTAREDSTWLCERHDAEIPYEWQLTGCRAHVLHPELVPWPMREGRDEWHAVFATPAGDIENGEHATSSEALLSLATQASEERL